MKRLHTLKERVGWHFPVEGGKVRKTGTRCAVSENPNVFASFRAGLPDEALRNHPRLSDINRRAPTRYVVLCPFLIGCQE